jgi:riboflavin kinase, archaea type
LTKLTFNGKIFTGRGEGKKYLSLPWVKQQIEETLGFTPFLGTLNLRLSSSAAAKKQLLENAHSVTVCPQEGYCTGLLTKAYINGIPCAIILPNVQYYPEDVLEIIAEANLRQTLKLSDGDDAVIMVKL